MNLFFPEPTIESSVKALDDKRLLKQILECKVILDEHIRQTSPDYDPSKKIPGYSNHPVIKYYTSTLDNYWLAMRYAHECCKEYQYRFKSTRPFETHSYEPLFRYAISNATQEMIEKKVVGYGHPVYIEGKTVVTDWYDVQRLFKAKLNNKWSNAKIPPKWTKRDAPDWSTLW